MLSALTVTPGKHENNSLKISHVLSEIVEVAIQDLEKFGMPKEQLCLIRSKAACCLPFQQAMNEINPSPILPPKLAESFEEVKAAASSPQASL